MKKRETLDQILAIIRSVMEDEQKLIQILDFLENEIVEEEEFEEIEEIEEIELPEKLKPLITEIAGSIDAGLVCFLNPETLEIDAYPRDLLYEIDLFDDEPEEVKKKLLELYDWEDVKVLDCDNFLEFNPIDSNEGYRIMEAFTERVKDEKLQNQLSHALGSRKPFASFRSIIDSSFRRQDWFDFKQKWLENRVAQELLDKLNYPDSLY